MRGLILRDLPGCLQNVPDQNMVDISFSQIFFQAASRKFEKVWKKASHNFKTSLQKGFLEDWASSKFPDICDSFLVAVHIAPLKCISATQCATLGIVQSLKCKCKVQFLQCNARLSVQVDCNSGSKQWLELMEKRGARAILSPIDSFEMSSSTCHNVTYGFKKSSSIANFANNWVLYLFQVVCRLYVKSNLFSTIWCCKP